MDGGERELHGETGRDGKQSDQSGAEVSFKPKLGLPSCTVISLAG